MTDTTKLPPLPLGDVRTENARGRVMARHYTDAQMLAYGAECRRAALDEAAKLCGTESVVMATRDMARGALRCMDAIRARSKEAGNA